MEKAVNTIRKQTVLFQYNGKTEGIALQKEITDWCNFTLIPEIEEQLEAFIRIDSYISIDKLEIEAAVNSADWKQKIKDSLIYELRQKLAGYKTAIQEKENGVTEKVAKLDELILFFLKTGFLPWWGKAMLEVDFKTLFRNWIDVELTPERAELISVQLEQFVSQKVVDRILYLLPKTGMFSFLRNIYRKYSETYRLYESFFEEEILRHLPPENQKLITGTVYRQLMYLAIKNAGNSEPEVVLHMLFKEVDDIQVLLNKLQSQAKSPVEISNPVSKIWHELLFSTAKQKTKISREKKSDELIKLKDKSGPEISDENKKQLQYEKIIKQLKDSEFEDVNINNISEELQEGIFIDNAGMVIFAAFIPTLFEKIGVVDSGKITNPDLAVMILQYCVSGKTQIEEYELVLPKILCGLAIDFPINTIIEITEEHKAEVNSMLESLINYWSALGNTSVDGLREAFLMRNGKLSRIDNSWQLNVEQKAYDILLERIPWSISMIKLPWMDTMLRTEWN